MASGARRAQDFGGCGFAEFTIGEMAPTTNRLNYNVPGKGRSRTATYRQWRDLTGWELKLQKVRPVEGRVTIFVSLPDHIPNSPDLDNTAKAIIDLLVAHRIVASDDKSCVRGLSLRWDPTVSRIHVRIEQCPPPTEKFDQGNKSPFLVRAYRYPMRTFATHSGRRPINLNALSKKQKPIASAQHPSHWSRSQNHGGQTDDAVLEWTSEGWWHPAAVTKRSLLMPARRKVALPSFMTSAELNETLRVCFGSGGQTQFARLTGISRCQISRYAKGHSKIPKHVALLARFFAYSVGKDLPIPKAGSEAEVQE